MFQHLERGFTIITFHCVPVIPAKTRPRRFRRRYHPNGGDSRVCRHLFTASMIESEGPILVAFSRPNMKIWRVSFYRSLFTAPSFDHSSSMLLCGTWTKGCDHDDCQHHPWLRVFVRALCASEVTYEVPGGRSLHSLSPHVSCLTRDADRRFSPSRKPTNLCPYTDQTRPPPHSD